MGLILRSASLANSTDNVTVKGSSLTYLEGDGNFMYLLSTMSGSNRIIGTLEQGAGVTASGVASHAEGINSIADGQGAHAEGVGQSLSQASHAEGLSVTMANLSHAEGFYSVTVDADLFYNLYDNGGKYYDSASKSLYVQGDVTSIATADSWAVALLFNTPQVPRPGRITSSTFGGGFTTIVFTEDINGGYDITQSVDANGVYFQPLPFDGMTGNSLLFNHAEGIYSIAVGQGAHAEGNATVAKGINSHAEGVYTLALSTGSHAEGTSTTAMGVSSHAEGASNYTGVYGYYATDVTSGVITISSSYGDVSSNFSNGLYAILDDSNYDDNYTCEAYLISSSSWNGTNTTINLVNTGISTTTAHIGVSNNPTPTGANRLTGGQRSHVEGDSSTSIGIGSHAEGYSSLTLGQFSHAEGFTAKAIGNSSHAEGTSTQAIGESSHAEGTSTVASGSYAHAEGSETSAEGNGSHTEGDNTRTTGNYSHAEGYNTRAIGISSHAEGNTTIAYGNYSHAEGFRTISSGSYQTSVGQYNAYNNTSSLFVVGGGLSDITRKDIFDARIDSNRSGSIMVPTNTSNPSNPTTGSMYFNYSTNLLYIYNGTAWRSASFA